MRLYSKVIHSHRERPRSGDCSSTENGRCLGLQSFRCLFQRRQVRVNDLIEDGSMRFLLVFFAVGLLHHPIGNLVAGPVKVDQQLHFWFHPKSCPIRQRFDNVNKWGKHFLDVGYLPECSLQLTGLSRYPKAVSREYFVMTSIVNASKAHSSETISLVPLTFSNLVQSLATIRCMTGCNAVTFCLEKKGLIAARRKR